MEDIKSATSGVVAFFGIFLPLACGIAAVVVAILIGLGVL